MSADLRSTILAEEQIQASKRRFALFNQPPPLAVGDDSYYKPTQHARGQNGKPITNPPQMLGGACKSGLTKSSYFSNPQSIHQKDPYKDPITLQLESQKKFHTRAKFHETQFKPSSGPKVLDKPVYNYKQQRTPAKKPIQRDQMGKVRTKPRNFVTNSSKKIQSQAFKPPKHMHDPYERKKELERQQHLNSKKKFQQGMFRSMSHGSKTFQKDSLIFGEDSHAKMMLSQRKQRSKSVFNIYPHQTNFKLARRGHGDTLGQYPKFIQKKTAETISNIKLKKEGDTQKKQSWKPNNFGLSRPTPSILFNPVSLKSGRYK